MLARRRRFRSLPGGGSRRQLIGDTNARTDVLPCSVADTAAIQAVAREQVSTVQVHPDRIAQRAADRGIEYGKAVIPLGASRLNIPAQADVEGQFPRSPE